MKQLTPLATSEVHILFSDLKRDTSDLARLEYYLAADERARAEHLRSGQVRDRFVAGRGFLREALSIYMGVRPEEIRFSYWRLWKAQLGWRSRLRTSIFQSLPLS